MSSRILFITRGIPYPPIGGAPIRNWQNIAAMSQNHSVGVLAFSDYGYVPETIPESLPGVSYFRFSPPVNFKNLFVRKLWNTGFIQKVVHPFFNVQSPTGAVLQEILKNEFPADVIVFEDYPKWWDLFNFAKKGRGPAIVYDAHNLETQLHRDIFKLNKEAKSQAIKEGVSYFRYLLRRLNRLWVICETEKALVSRASQIWVCSNEDDRRFKEKFGDRSSTLLVPNTVDVQYLKRPSTFTRPSELQEFAEDKVILFPAILNYPPNEEAARLIITEIFPGLVERLPEVRICFAGKNPSKFLLQAAAVDKRIVVTGAVEDIRPYFWSSSALIAPILTGGGTRIKILEAFAAGLPVVSTTKGVEGIECISNTHLIVADTNEAIVEALFKVLGDNNLSQRLTHSAFELVSRRYSLEALNSIFKEWRPKDSRLNL